MIDDSEAVLLIRFYKNVRNGSGFAGIGGIVAIVDPNAIHKERIWDGRYKCTLITCGAKEARNDCIRQIMPCSQPE